MTKFLKDDNGFYYIYNDVTQTVLAVEHNVEDNFSILGISSYDERFKMILGLCTEVDMKEIEPILEKAGTDMETRIEQLFEQIATEELNEEKK